MNKLTPMKREILQALQAGPLFRNASGYSRAGTQRFPTVPVRQLVEIGFIKDAVSRSGAMMVLLTDRGLAALGKAPRPRAAEPPGDDSFRLHDRIAP